jgi:hypothetical protein
MAEGFPNVAEPKIHVMYSKARYWRVPVYWDNYVDHIKILRGQNGDLTDDITMC